MTRLTRLCRAVGVGLAVITATLTMTQVANAAPAPPTLPDTAKNIAVDAAKNKVFLVGHVLKGAGVQIYKCVGTGWVFDAPSATLSADNDKNIVEHGRGPTWTAKDVSTVGGTVLQRATVDPTAIPWLKLQAVSPTAGADGDRLAHTTFIQRVNTVGGLQPAGTCDPTVTPEARVPYQADYYFWKATGPGAP
jgi:hypothetical protein